MFFSIISCTNLTPDWNCFMIDRSHIQLYSHWVHPNILLVLSNLGQLGYFVEPMDYIPKFLSFNTSIYYIYPPIWNFENMTGVHRVSEP